MTDVSLAAVFEPDQGPQILKVERATRVLTIHLFVSASLSWFRGHFPEQPVLPGVVQLHWACVIGQHYFPQLSQFVGLRNVKFKQMWLPDTYAVLRLTLKPETGQLAFEFLQANALNDNPNDNTAADFLASHFSSGAAVFAVADSATPVH